MSPAPSNLPASVPSFSSICQSHAGYSLSSIASGSCWPLSSASPRRGVPAGTDDCTITSCTGGCGSFRTASLSLRDGVRGVLKGCAAEVDIATCGGDCGVCCTEEAAGAVLLRCRDGLGFGRS